ncbi:MAG: hypothetical protein L3J83_09440 [Proteobacteria bacterium]|nr:hypothetical protein [Pseudomonadota bacterium]
MVKKITAFIVILLSPEITQATKWSRFITTENHEGVIISFRQMKVKNSWLVEWQVNNKSNQTIEPFLKYRHYSCEDDSTLKLTNSTLGTYSPSSRRHGDLIDKQICPNSKIKLVEIETEIKINDDRL